MILALKNRLARHELWLGITIFVLAGSAAWRAANNASGSLRWPAVVDQGQTVPFTTPALLPTGLIWQQAETTPGLLYRSFTSSGPDIPIMTYPDVFPQEWQASPSSESNYHLVWLEQDGRLRNAVINPAGETVRGPIELGAEVQPGFSIIPREDRLLVLWLDSRKQLSITELDESGRPRAPQHPLAERIERAAGALDQSDQLHLAWLTASESSQWAVRYLTFPVDQLDSETFAHTPTTLFTFSLSPRESLASFSMGLDQTTAYLLWSTSQADQPNQERVYLWVFPIADPQGGSLSEITLPDSHPAPLRWVHPVAGQQMRLILTLASQTETDWHPAVAFFQAGKLVDFQIVAQQPANAGSPAAILEKNGSIRIAWASRQRTAAHLLLTSQQNTKQDDSFSTVLIAGLVRLPLAFLWLLIPSGLFWISPRFVPLSLALFVAAQLIWPRDLFSTIPPLLTDRFQPAFVVGITVLLIGTTAGIVCAGLLRYKPRIQQAWLVFFLIDALLTWLIFGPNIG